MATKKYIKIGLLISAILFGAQGCGFYIGIGKSTPAVELAQRNTQQGPTMSNDMSHHRAAE